MHQNVRANVEQVLRDFFTTKGQKLVPISSDLNMIADLGLKSDEGIDLALDLEDCFNIEISHELNPIVHKDGHRGVTFGELVTTIEGLIEAGMPSK